MSPSPIGSLRKALCLHLILIATALAFAGLLVHLRLQRTDDSFRENVALGTAWTALATELQASVSRFHTYELRRVLSPAFPADARWSTKALEEKESIRRTLTLLTEAANAHPRAGDAFLSDLQVWNASWARFLDESEKLARLQALGRSEEAGALVHGPHAGLFEISQAHLEKLVTAVRTAETGASASAAGEALWTIAACLCFALLASILFAIRLTGNAGKMVARAAAPLEGAFPGELERARWHGARALRGCETVGKSIALAQAGARQSLSALETQTRLVKENADTAFQISTAARSTFAIAAASDVELSALGAVMRDVAQGMRQLEELAPVVEILAAQAKLLALNAAVEAARNGESGKCLAVLADAVRDVSQKTSGVARDITTLAGEVATCATRGVQFAESHTQALRDARSAFQCIADQSTAVARVSLEQSMSLDTCRLVLRRVAQSLDESSGELLATVESAAESSALTNALAAHFQTGGGVPLPMRSARSSAAAVQLHPLPTSAGALISET